MTLDSPWAGRPASHCQDLGEESAWELSQAEQIKHDITDTCISELFLYQYIHKYVKFKANVLTIINIFYAVHVYGIRFGYKDFLRNV